MALNLESVEGIFYVTVYGMALACVMVVVEMFLHNLKISYRKKRSLKKALREEFLFYLKFGENVKPVSTDDDSEEAKEEEQDGYQQVDDEKQYSPPPIGFIIDQKLENNGSCKNSRKRSSSSHRSISQSNGKSKRSTR